MSYAWLVCTLAGCDLERDFMTTTTKENVNRQIESMRGMNAALYDNMEIPFEGQLYFDSPASDESNDVWIGESETFNNGSWNQYSNVDQKMGAYYNAIRRINDFLNPVIPVNLDAWKLSPLESDQLIYRNYLADLENWNREARFLRAFFYFELVKRYGGVPVITQTLSIDTDFASIGRNTLNECFKFIIDELDDITRENNSLPLTYDADNLGRATKGAALALKSRVLLYKASELFNAPEKWAPGYEPAGLISIKGEDREKLWKDAADAAKQVIDLGVYTLANDYTVIGKNYTDNEFIFLRKTRDLTNNYEWDNSPRGYLAARGRINPSQNLVDSYEMKDGSRFDWSLNGTDPYSNRDPRLGMTVYHNGSAFKDTPLEIYEGGLHGERPDLDHTTGTGYYIRKFMDEGLDLSQDRKSYHIWSLIRISEVYLNYAEALNEYSPGHPDILACINKIRDRENVGMPPVPEGSQQTIRERIRNERRIELAFEGHRFWDLRRWLIAADELGRPLQGVKIQREGNGYKYNRIEVENRKFSPGMYLHPVPQNVLLTEGVNWVQNPLWNE